MTASESRQSDRVWRLAERCAAPNLLRTPSAMTGGAPKVRLAPIAALAGALRDANEKLATVFRESPDVIVVADLTSAEILTVNWTARHRLGYEPDDLVGKPLSMLFQAPLALAPALLDLVRTHGGICEEQDVRRIDGSLCPMDVTARLIQWEGENAVIVTLRDVTYRKRAQDALRRAEEKYRNIFEHAVEGIFQTTADGRYLSANPALARMYGYESAADLIANLTDIADQLYVEPDRRAAFERIMSEHDAVRGYESQIRRKDGRIVWIAESARAVRDANGRLLYYEGMVTDITARKEAEAANARLIEELEAANRLKSEFVATMSHELRTPLNIILGFDEVLLHHQAGPLTAEQRDLVQRIDHNARSLHELIDTTLDLSRLANGRLRVDRRSASVAALLSELENDVRELQDKPGVTLSFEIDPDLPALRTDPAKLKIVLKNLVGNALKFTERGRVTVAARGAENGIELAVSDTGIGIAPEMMTAIFEPFRQGDGSDTRRYGGVGLGLHVVRRLMTLLGGTVKVASTPGEGSTFRIWLPA